MATIARRLQAEIDRANDATNKQDATIHEAIGSLIDGYGQGGDGVWERPADWPTPPNDTTPGNKCVYVLMENIDDSIIVTSRTQIIHTFSIGTTDSDGNFTEHISITQPSFRKEVAFYQNEHYKDLGRYFWIKAEGNATTCDLYFGRYNVVQWYPYHCLETINNGTTSAMLAQSNVTPFTEHYVFSNMRIEYVNDIFKNGHNIKAVELRNVELTGPIFNYGNAKNIESVIIDGCTIDTNTFPAWTASAQFVKQLTINGISYAQLPTSAYNMLNGMKGWSNDQIQEVFKTCNLSSVKDIRNTFTDCTQMSSIDFAGKSMTNVTSLESAFSGCYNLKRIEWGESDLSNVTTFNGTFSSCRSLESIRLPGDEIHPTTVFGIFNGCWGLKSLDLSNVIFDKCTNMTYAFNEIYELEDLILSPNADIKLAIGFGSAINLTHDSLLSLLNALGTVDKATVCTLGNDNKDKLTTEEIAIATQKGWTVA